MGRHRPPNPTLPGRGSPNRHRPCTQSLPPGQPRMPHRPRARPSRGQAPTRGNSTCTRAPPVRPGPYQQRSVRLRRDAPDDVQPEPGRTPPTRAAHGIEAFGETCSFIVDDQLHPTADAADRDREPRPFGCMGEHVSINASSIAARSEATTATGSGSSREAHQSAGHRGPHPDVVFDDQERGHPGTLPASFRPVTLKAWLSRCHGWKKNDRPSAVGKGCRMSHN